MLPNFITAWIPYNDWKMLYGRPKATLIEKQIEIWVGWLGYGLDTPSRKAQDRKLWPEFAPGHPFQDLSGENLICNLLTSFSSLYLNRINSNTVDNSLSVHVPSVER